MNRVNLIPPQRRRAKAHRRRLFAWIAVDGSIAGALLAAAMVIYLLQNSARLPDAELDRVRQQIDQSQKQLVSVRIALAQSQQTADASAAVSNQPDWSALLAVLARSLGDDVVLDRCELMPIAPPEPLNLPVAKTVALNTKASPPSPPVADRVALHIGGLARSQDAAAQFILRLQRLGLFERVQLLQTSGQETLSRQAVHFELDCPLRGRLAVSS